MTQHIRALDWTTREVKVGRILAAYLPRYLGAGRWALAGITAPNNVYWQKGEESLGPWKYHPTQHRLERYSVQASALRA